LQSVAIGDPRSWAQAVGTFGLVLSATVVGHSVLLRAAFWLVALVIARRHPAWAILPAGIAAALHGSVGHAAATEDLWLRAAMTLHLLAAGAWLGGLLPLYLALREDDPGSVARRFSWLGVVCVATLGATALVLANALAGGLPGLVGTAYGWVLLTKIGLFLGMLALAARNRFVLTPRLAGAPRALDRSVAVEIGLGVVLVGAAALLASLPPGAHEQPDWPFPWRPSLDVLADDDLRAEIGHALLGLAAAGALVVAATLLRRLRVVALLAAGAIVWFALPSLQLLLVPAEPTYYWLSPSTGDAAAIARGQAAYLAHCVACHGPGGHGDGPLAAGLPIPPADLTAPHLWDHSDGELFWWISHGMVGPDGRTVMPGAAATLDAMTRWELIDFLHSNNTAGGVTMPRMVHHH
jgi:putative copper export protein/mono/diheme cytochrome c family protein